MGLKGFFKTIGGFFKTVLSGLVQVFIEDFEDVAEKIVLLLMFSDQPGGKKFETALAVLKGYAATEGKKFINHAARLLIQLELTEAEGDDLERIVDEGLGAARQAVEAVNEFDLVGDDERRDAAAIKLRDDLIAAGKQWLTKPRTLHTLIELAVANLRIE